MPLTNLVASLPGESKIQRFPFLDSMRGVAAMAVACFHFQGLVTLEHTQALFGPVLDWVFARGDLGVEVFFVLSGFVLTHFLRPLQLSLPVVGRFMLRRSVRLDPTYWVVLFVTIAVNAVLTRYGVMHRPHVLIGLVLANMCYLQDLLRVHSPVNAAWTLCIEMQFYLFFVMLLWAFQWLRERVPLRIARLLVFGPPAIVSLLMASGHLPTMPGLFLDRWHFFFLGVLAYWALMGILSSVWFWIYVVAMLVHCDASILGGVGSGLVILGCGRLGLLEAKTRGRILPYLGSRSYSLYLVHVLVGSNLIRVLLRLNWVSTTPLVLIGYFVLAIIASLIAAEILYRLVERPTHLLGRRIAWQSPSAAPVAAQAETAKVSIAGTQCLPAAAGSSVSANSALRWPAFITALRSELSWLIPVSAFAAIWLTELYVVQELTLSPGYTGGRSFDFFAPKIRFMMDVCFVGACMSVLDRWGLVIVAIAGSVMNLAFLTYFDYFYYPMSLLHLLQNRKEGMELSAFAWDILDGATILSLAAVLALKLFILKSTPPAPRWRSPAWLGFFGCFAMGYVTLFVVANHFDPLEKIAYKRTMGRLGIIRGYLGPWIAEFYYLNDERLVQQAIDRREFKSDQLTPIEIPLQIEPHLVIIQAESLDQNMIGHRVNGQEVTPFLNRLRDRSMYFRIKVFHYQGSCDSDFTMLEGVAATARVNPYSMPNYPFENSLPQILKEHGYRAIALHGYRSAFYDRGAAFFKMGFERSLFQERARTRFRLAGVEFWHHRPGSVSALLSHVARKSRADLSLHHHPDLTHSVRIRDANG